MLCGAEVQDIGRDRHGLARRNLQGRRSLPASVVNAAGPWAARIGRMVGLDLPVTGTVQQVIVTEPAPPLTRHLIAVANRHLSLKQQASGGFLVGGGWFGGFDPETGRTRNLRRNIEGNLWVCGQVLPALHGLSIHPRLDRHQFGDRPRPDPGRGAGPARVLQRGQRQWLHAGADHRADHRGRGAAGGTRSIRITRWNGLDSIDHRFPRSGEP